MSKRRLPIGIQTFRKIRQEDCYYVDKTAYIRRLLDEGTHYFLSRPRRFGKSLFLDTLKELFEGNQGLFAGLHIHDRWDWSVRYPVLQLDFGRGNFKESGYVKANLMAQLDAVERRTGVASDYATEPERFAHLLEMLHDHAGQPVAVLIDEYDKPILDALEVPDIARANRDFLRGLYAVIKASDAHVRFTFITGVSKFSKVSLFPRLNNLKDITLDPRYSAICGYTEADLDAVFAPELPGLDRAQIREWYNGYSWLGDEQVYNPSTSSCCSTAAGSKPTGLRPARRRFWSRRCANATSGSLDLDGMESSDELLSTFDVDDIATEALLFQTGYLTITDAKDRGGESGSIGWAIPTARCDKASTAVCCATWCKMRRDRRPTVDSSTTSWKPTTLMGCRRCFTLSSPAFPTSGTRIMTSPAMKAITPACSIRISRRWVWMFEWRTAAVRVARTWRFCSTATSICSSSRWSSWRLRVRRWRSCRSGAMRISIAPWSSRFT